MAVCSLLSGVGRMPEHHEPVQLRMNPEKIILPNNLFFEDVTRLLVSGEKVTIPVKGNSMEPFLVGGRDQVVLQKSSLLKVGDIVLVCLPEKGYVLHRIYRLSAGMVILMGDGNLCATECCRPKDIQGKVIQIIRNGRVVDCQTVSERWRVRLWQWLLPWRRIILGIYKRYANKGMY